MSQFRSITLATKNIDKTIDLFHNMLGMVYQQQQNKVQFGDAHCSPGTRIQFVEINETIEPDHQHFNSIGLRTPTDKGLEEYKEILHQHSYSFEGPFKMNGNPFIQFNDANGQRFAIFSNEHNVGVGLGFPSEKSSVNPLHQVQGLGPIILMSNEVIVTLTLLTKIFGFQIKGEYTLPGSEQRVIVLEGDGGGLGSEIHIYEATSNIQFPPYGIVEQLEFTAQNDAEYQSARQQLDFNEIPYQQLKNDKLQTRSIRVNDVSGISFILTLAHGTKGS